MTEYSPSEQKFLNRISEIIRSNLSDEKFGVSELASMANMSRSNLLRRINKLTDLSVSQFIRNERLGEAMKMLMEEAFNVTEVSYRVGFSSPSYFIKCFHDHFGFPPGEVGNRISKEPGINKGNRSGRDWKRMVIASSVLVAGVVIILGSLYFLSADKREVEKSIAVLPFKNDSDDASNLYIINGITESVLNNLQNIKNLRVISRTSVEKYRDQPKLITEMAEELDVKYFVEGSGQKIGDQIFLNVQLIDATSDKHLWAEQYIREVNDIFDLQLEVAKSIAQEIEAIITPEEASRIEKMPTEDIVAYDYFLRGQYLMYRGEAGDLDSAIYFYEKAILQDAGFARAYASIAVCYYFMDMFQEDKIYYDSINKFADKALLLDPTLSQSLIAKALFYINSGQSIQALPYLEKALEYNPNSILVINILSDFYTSVIPNSSKYLEYALKGLRLELPPGDSVSASYSYLHVSNALIQSGFTDEALYYIDRSLDLLPGNLYSEYVKAYIIYARDRDLGKTLNLLKDAYAKDTSRWDILQEVAKINYYLRDYEEAYFYYKQFNETRTSQNLDVYRFENAKIGVVLSEVGLEEESRRYFEEFKIATDNDHSLYRHLNYAVYYSFKDDTRRAIEELNLFLNETNYSYWTVLFLEIDPLMDNIRDDPQFEPIIEKIENKFWDRHLEIKRSLKEDRLI